VGDDRHAGSLNNSHPNSHAPVTYLRMAMSAFNWRHYLFGHSDGELTISSKSSAYSRSVSQLSFMFF